MPKPIIKRQKKEVYIPIEIKAREFASQVFLSGQLAKTDARVFLGSKASIDRLINEKKKTCGVYLYKGGGSSIEKFKKLAPKVSSIAVLDQEVSPALKSYDYIRIRFVAGSLDYVSRLYYVGPASKNAAVDHLKDFDASKIRDYGWPRVDLWMPKNHHIWSDAINQIQNEYGRDFILFSSDFGANSRKLVEERSLRLEIVGAQKTQQELALFRASQNTSYDNFNHFIDFLHELDSDARLPTIIIRPHPAEDHAVWTERTSHLKNVKVVYRGDITPWLLASSGLLHRGCTTAIQAVMSNTKTGYLIDYADRENTSVVPDLSPSLSDIEDVVSWNNDNRGSISFDIGNSVLKNHITLSNENATAKIADDLLNLAGDPAPMSVLKKASVLRRSISALSKALRRSNKQKSDPHRLGKLPKYNKMQDGIGHAEVSGLLARMYPDAAIHADQIIDDLCVIEKIDS